MLLTCCAVLCSLQLGPDSGVDAASAGGGSGRNDGGGDLAGA